MAESRGTTPPYFHSPEALLCCSVLRVSHLQRALLRRHAATPLPRPFHTTDLAIRILTYLTPVELFTSVFPLSTSFLSLSFHPVLWQVVYLCGCPLKFSPDVQDLFQLLSKPLNDTSFDVHELEERERYHDLIVGHTVTGYYRVLSLIEEGKFLFPSTVTSPELAVSYCIGYEIGKRVQASDPIVREDDSGTISLDLLRTALVRVWKELFGDTSVVCGKFGEGDMWLRGRLCRQSECAEAHLDPTWVCQLVKGALRYVLHLVDVDAEATGACEMQMILRVHKGATQMTCKTWELKPNVMYYVSGCRVLDSLLEAGAVEKQSVEEWLHGLCSGGENALRRTPAERNSIQCPHCHQIMSAFIYAVEHRCVAKERRSSSSSSQPFTPTSGSSHSPSARPYCLSPCSPCDRLPSSSPTHRAITLDPPMTSLQLRRAAALKAGKVQRCLSLSSPTHHTPTNNSHSPQRYLLSPTHQSPLNGLSTPQNAQRPPLFPSTPHHHEPSLEDLKAELLRRRREFMAQAIPELGA